MIKNYVVKMKKVGVSDYQKYIKYMFDEDHKNHLNTEIVKSKNDNNNIEDKIISGRNLINENENYKIRNKKAGRKIKTLYFSYTYNLPKKYENITKEQMQEILESVLKKSITFLQSIDENFEESEMKEYYKNCISSIHSQENNHFHLLYPTIFPSGKNSRRISQRNFLRMNKIIFTETVDNILKKDIKQYESENVTQYEVDIKKLINELNLLNEKQTNEKNKKFISTTIIYLQRFLKSKGEDKKSLNLANVRIEKMNKKRKNKFKTIKM